MKAIDDDEAIIRRRLLSSALPLMKKEDGEQLKGRLEAFACRAMIISDAGHEQDITRALRRMHVYNPIPSKFGEWAPGQRVKSITTERIIEDPIFRDSAGSPFLQLVDCASFALLKRETTPTKLVKKYNLHKMFDAALAPLCFRKASSAAESTDKKWNPRTKKGHSRDPSRIGGLAEGQIDSADRDCALQPSPSRVGSASSSQSIGRRGRPLARQRRAYGTADLGMPHADPPGS